MGGRRMEQVVAERANVDTGMLCSSSSRGRSFTFASFFLGEGRRLGTRREKVEMDETHSLGWHIPSSTTDMEVYAGEGRNIALAPHLGEEREIREGPICIHPT